MKDAVGLGCRRHMVAAQPPGQIEGVAENAVGSSPGKDGFLDNCFVFSAGVEAAADLGVLPFGILAHDPHVDVAWISIAKRRRYPRQQPHRPQVDVLIKFAPNGDQKPP